MKKNKKNFLPVSIFSLGFFLLSPSVTAQVIPDRTLRQESSIVNSFNSLRQNIDGGAVRGNNLFHSFQEFNINTGQSVYFNAPGINNIFTRVTGNNVSNILGTLGVNGNANLFLMNPNGIIFGNNAKLDLNGSFFASTAETLKWNNGSEFSAILKNVPSVNLTHNFPSGLGFGSTSKNIKVEGVGHKINYELSGSGPTIGGPLIDFETNRAGLKIADFQTIGLFGNQVELNGGLITAPSGRIEIGSVNQGIVDIKPSVNGFTFNYDKVNSFGDIKLDRKALLDASGLSNGIINIRGSNLAINNGSLILVNNFGSSVLPTIDIKTSESVVLNGTTAQNNLFNDLIQTNVRGIAVQNFSEGKGADINISTKNIILKNYSTIVNNNFGTGNSGNINIKVEENLEVQGTPPIDLNFLTTIITILSFSSGSIGDINLSGQNLKILNGGNISSQSIGTAKNNGSINALFSETVEINGSYPFIQEFSINGNIVPVLNFTPSSLATAAFSSGNAGNVNISTSSLTVKNGGRLSSTTLSSGNAGNLNIEADRSVQIIGSVLNPFINERENSSQITSSADIPNSFFASFFSLNTVPSGKSGSIDLKTKNLNIEDTGLINVFNEGTGNAGFISLRVDNAFLNNGKISASSSSRIGGTISISGYKPLNPSSIISLDNRSSIETNNSTTTNFNVGTIDIFAHDLTLNNGSTISANVSDLPQNPLDPNLNLVGGNVNIQATGDIRILNNSSIAAEVSNRPGGAIDGGNINIETQGNILLSNNISPRAAISASVDEFGNGGNINITLPNGVIVAVNNADIRANAIDGDGGNIIIEAFSILTTPDIDISASSERGVDGVVEVNSTVNAENFLTVEETDLPSYNQAILSTCKRANNGEGGTFEENQNLPQTPSTRSTQRYIFNSFLSTVSRPNVGKTIEDIKMLEPNATIEINGDVYLGKVCLTKIQD